MLQKLNSRHLKWVVSGCFIIIFGYAFLVQWPGIVIDDEPCYSPNHEFYIKRVKSWFSYLYIKDADMFGVVRVYRKDGKPLLSFRQENFSYEFGPMWYGKTITYAINDGTVIDLPSEVGAHTEDKRCF